MSQATSSSSTGVGFVGLLTILLVAAKLWGKIGWSWWWVFSPLLITWSILLVVIALALSGAGFKWWLEQSDRRRRF